MISNSCYKTGLCECHPHFHNFLFTELAAGFGHKTVCSMVATGQDNLLCAPRDTGILFQHIPVVVVHVPMV